MITVEPIFPTAMHWQDADNFDKDSLVDYVYSQREEDPEGLMKSNVGGWQSQGNYHRFENPLQIFLKDFLTVIVNSGIYKSDTSITVTQMWININNKGDYNTFHSHAMCDISGTFWIKVPENSGKLRFLAPNEFEQANMIQLFDSKFREEFNFHNAYTIDPVEGRLFMWPSHLYHEVGINKSDEDRISVAFNLALDGSN